MKDFIYVLKTTATFNGKQCTPEYKQISFEYKDIYEAKRAIVYSAIKFGKSVYTYSDDKTSIATNYGSLLVEIIEQEFKDPTL